jgi:hypothetical protein
MCNQHPIDDYDMIASCIECRAEVYIGDYDPCAWCGKPACPECRIFDSHREPYCSEECIDEAEMEADEEREEHESLRQYIDNESY